MGNGNLKYVCFFNMVNIDNSKLDVLLFCVIKFVLL